ncbi:MAG: alpha/beta hydrolase [Pseudomonadota bacterium]
MKRFAFLFVCTGLFFNLAACATHPEPPGKMVAVDGHLMHLYCTGPESPQPTVILEGANMGLSPFYRNLQESLEQTIRVCSYDRAGIAWSEPSDNPRESRFIAAELHELLREAGLKPPFLLAGHSLGGLFVLRYAHDYPDEVAGLALLDASHPDQNTLVADPAKQIAGELKILAWLRRLQWLGVSHVYNPYRVQLQPLPPAAFEQALYFTHQPSMADAIIGETRSRIVSMAQAGEVKTLGALPLLVVSAGAYQVNPERSAEDTERLKTSYERWQQFHLQYLALSTNSRHVVIEGSNHYTLISNKQFAQRASDEIIKLANAPRQ